MRPKYGLLLMCKPLTMRNAYLYQALQDILKDDGELLARRYWKPVPVNRLEGLYDEHKGKPFFSTLTHAFEGSDSFTWIYATNDTQPEKWVEHVRNGLIGKTCLEEASPGSFRRLIHEDMGIRVREKIQNREYFDTGVHCSASMEDGKREGGIFYWDYSPREEIGFLF